MISSDNNDEDDTSSSHGADPKPVIEASAVSGDGNDKDDTPPDKDLSHWGDFDEAAWPVLERYGYRNSECSGNWIFNKLLEILGRINYPNPIENINPYVFELKIMFRKCDAAGEIDFDL